LLPPKTFELDAFGRTIYLRFIEISDENVENADFIIKECDAVLIVVDEKSKEKEKAVNSWLNRVEILKV
jgi:hypothetical protein